ncbi:MAG: flagellar motor switch protein FliM [Acidobacteriaceae bacterium]
MEKILGQDEIDALFLAAQSGITQTETEKSKSKLRVESYSFSRAGQINNDQLRAISTVNDLFARNLKHNLGTWLRTSFDVNLVSAEQLPFSDFLTRVPEFAYVCSVRLEPLGALAVLELDLTLAAPMIDLLLGGVGSTSAVRELTDIEESILTSVVEIICRELSVAWQPLGLRVLFEKRELPTQITRLLPMVEKTLCVSFEIRMPEAQGMLNISFPAVVSNTILRRLIHERDQFRRRPPETRARMMELMAQVKFGAVLQLPPVRIAARELAGLAPGNLLRLSLPKHADAELLISGSPIFQATAARSGEVRAALLGEARQHKAQKIQMPVVQPQLAL